MATTIEECYEHYWPCNIVECEDHEKCEDRFRDETLCDICKLNEYCQHNYDNECQESER